MWHSACGTSVCRLIESPPQSACLNRYFRSTKCGGTTCHYLLTHLVLITHVVIHKDNTDMKCCRTAVVFTMHPTQALYFARAPTVGPLVRSYIIAMHATHARLSVMYASFLMAIPGVGSLSSVLVPEARAVSIASGSSQPRFARSMRYPDSCWQ
jgi:hypothetical protein